MLSYVNHLGREIDPAAQRPERPVKPKREVEPKSLGFRVVGLPPGATAAAKSLADRLERDGGRPWSESSWLRSVKRERISAKNLQVRGAADLVAEMAVRGGWEHVEVQEVTRGDVDGARKRLTGSF